MTRAHRTAHRRIWLGLLLAIPAMLIVSMAIRQDLGREIPAEKLPDAGRSLAAQ